ncbi:5-methylcytosine rRNA methyltransferase NSUN4 [Galendromus occidentalis]|uniref:NOL1/NOP2/Sun domain family member 4 n=1 Tax=Galendromus occidentalis TaxID=34638 RepID=A0AAJ6QVG6_9ACAR|nr:5-methylcytosine rRNA methyltransferase NSUN4 [Galendromus occidentalis]
MAALLRLRWAKLHDGSLVRESLKLAVAHKSKLAVKKLPPDFALEHFDAFYPRVFGATEWRSIRLALLSQKKYCAVINPFAESSELHESMKNLGAERIVAAPPASKGYEEPEVNKAEIPKHIPMIEEQLPQEFLDSSRVIKKGHSEPLLSFVPATEMVYQEDVVHEEDYFNFLKPEAEIMMKTHKPIPFPPLSVYVYPACCVWDFPPPQENGTGIFNYYLMDAASLFPVMALDIQEGDNFADFCAAPGGKTLAVAFLEKTGSHLCTDESPSRVQRLRRSITSYLPEELRKSIAVKHIDMTRMSDDILYDKILVDVPCTNDRHSLFEEDNNIFRGTRIQERLHLPQTQSAILKQALRKLRVGGALVYSTCSLSPIQNDSVVHMSVQSFKTMKFVVTNLGPSFEPLRTYFQLHKCRYGQLVLPYLPNNFGPMYISRIDRIQ